MRRFAEKTQVPISRSRGEIDQLLREWGADAIQWSDDLKNNKVMLRFLWTWQDHQYVARLTIGLPTAKDLEKNAINKKTGGISQSKLNALLTGRGRQEHRVLALWLKAAFNAVAAGIVTAESLFMAFFEGKDGQTLGEVALPKMPLLLSGRADKLLPAVGGHSKGE